MVKQLIFLFLLLTQISSIGQINKANNWVIGDSVLIEFKNSGVFVQNFPFTSLEGVSVYNDNLGRLKYWSNGEVLFTSNGNKYNVSGNKSTTQSSIFINHPYDSSLVLFFALGTENLNKLTCYIINNNLDNGNGGVVDSISVADNLAEKLALTQAENKKDYWLIVKPLNNSEYKIFKIDSTLNFDKPILSGGTNKFFNNYFRFGSIKFSPSGRYFCSITNNELEIDLFRFDKISGVLSYLFSIPTYESPYSVEFSPDETKLYVSSRFELAQYNLYLRSPIDIIKSKYIIDNDRPEKGTIQLGPDNRIYISQLGHFLGVINNPDSLLTEINYLEEGIEIIKGILHWGLPNFPSNYFYDSARVKNFFIDSLVPESINHFPNSFTPNNDNLNDCYNIRLAGTPVFFRLTVFNTLGMRMFETNDPFFCWDGKDMNSDLPLPLGVYYFIFEIAFPNDVTLIKKMPVLLLS